MDFLETRRKGIVARIAATAAILLGLFQLYSAGYGTMEALTLRATHLGFILVLVFLWMPLSDRYASRGWVLAIDMALALGAVAVTVYLLGDLERIQTRMRYVDPVSGMDLVMGIAAAVLVLEGTRRASGSEMFWFTLFSLAYVFAGPWLPQMVGHAGVTLNALIEQLYLLTDGIYGIPLGAAATYVFVFVVLGAVMERTGIASYFIDLASYLTGSARGGPAKMAVVSSALFGTVSGSAVANVMVDGPITIPLMKRVGYSPEFAGAVEAVASTGGQIMPPVMGAAAFIMADLLEVPYLTIATAALIPALLYFLSLFAAVHFRALRLGLRGLSAEELPKVRSVLERSYVLLPLILLVVLVASRMSVMLAALYSILAAWLISLFRKETRLGPRGIADVLILAARNSLLISTACAASGIIIGVILMTNIGFKAVNAITLLGAGSLFLSLVLTMLACLVLGIGAPTAAAYIIVAMLVVPGLVKLGVPALAAHMFVFYFAIVSVITPPVAIAAFAGASIAGAPAMATGWIATRLGIVAYIVPFMFVYQPALLGQGNLFFVLWVGATATLGLVALAAGIEGWSRHAANPLLQRIMLVAGGLALVYPTIPTNVIGFLLIAGVGVWQWIAARGVARPIGGAE